MHYHVLVKLTALVLTVVLLCTVAVSGLGILALNETGLYRQSLEKAYREYITGYAQSHGSNALTHYLSQELGGATRQMTEAHYGDLYRYGMFNWGKVGYIIRNEAGEVVSESSLAEGEVVTERFTVPATGSYLNVHETVSAQEYDNPTNLSPDRSYAVVEQEHLIFDAIPEEGVEIHSILVGGPDSSEGISSPEGMGRICHLPDGKVMFVSHGPISLETLGSTVTHIICENETLGVVYEASCPGGVGTLSENQEGYVSFMSSVVSPVWEANHALPDNAPAEGITEESVPVNPIQEAPRAMAEDAGVDTMRYYDGEAGMEMVAFFTYEPMPDYTVEVVLAENALRDEYSWVLLGLFYQYKDRLLPVLGVSLVLLIFCTVYLCCAAARRPGTEERRAGGMNRFPVDVYALLCVGGITILAVAGVQGMRYFMDGSVAVALSFAGAMLFLAAMLLVAFCFAFVAQVKTPDGFLWNNSLTVRVLDLLLRCVLWGLRMARLGAETLVFPLAKRVFRWVVGIIRGCMNLLVRILRRIWRSFANLVALLPLAWQWFLGGAVMFGSLFIALVSRSEGLLVLSLVFGVGMILYGTRAFGILLAAVKHMSRGELDRQVDDPWLLGSFREFAQDLNSLADVAVVAAQKQLKSERMKTELITNISHDIKTPLTSIINYVDLLEKPHTPEQREEYLAVLSRQSQRLKKLVEDLMEMSKASTGNLMVELQRLDAVEAVNQALGEFSEKLEAAGLIPVFRHPEGEVTILADGAMTWRVLSNLLSNAVKYALPGTRLYLDLTRVEGNVVFSLKNISREELNIQAEELLERFVRGDRSRNTEGSGLGLNIAQSLMQLQKGSLRVLVDGDLFKVTLTFPAAE